MTKRKKICHKNNPKRNKISYGIDIDNFNVPKGYRFPYFYVSEGFAKKYGCGKMNGPS